MLQQTFNGKTYDVYTSEDWERDSTLKVKEGQVIEPEVYWQLLNAVPPKSYRGHIFQPGEPYSHDWNTGQALFQTFESMGGNYYLYVGLQP